MKRIIAAALLAIAPLAQAIDCAGIGGLATSIMGARQRGAPMSDMMKIAGDNKLVQQMVIEAFEKPRFSSDSYREKAVQDFRAEWELACYKSSRDAT